MRWKEARTLKDILFDDSLDYQGALECGGNLSGGECVSEGCDCDCDDDYD